MIFEQLFDTKSSTYTYVISSGEGREALIIDPVIEHTDCLLYTSPSPRDRTRSRMPSSA